MKQNFTICILGSARNGKDTTAEMINKHYGLTFSSSSMAAAEIFIYDELKAKYNYNTFEECFTDRMNRRKEWHDLICDYNKEDKARLAKEILKKSDMYVGMRSNEEVEECIKQGLFNLVIGIFDPRKPEEPKDSFNIDIWKKSDIIIYNNGTLEDLERKVKKLNLPVKQVKQWWEKPLKRVWIDLDGVCFDFEQHFLKSFNLPLDPPNDWHDSRFKKDFNKTYNNEDFWLNCPTLIKPEQLTYPITGYCTARPVHLDITKQSLINNGFPAMKIINVGEDGDKAVALKEEGCDIMLDDSIYNFQHLNSNGILCYLMTRPHNIKFDVGNMRVNNIEEFFDRIKA